MIKTESSLISLVFYSILLMTSSQCWSQMHQLTLQITGIENSKGKLAAELYSSKGNFLKKAYKISTAKIQSHTATVIFNDLPKATYTVMVYHDENNNGKLDKNFIGMPKEPVACSNNAKGFMGPPKYEEAKFALETDLKMTIKMNDKL